MDDYLYVYDLQNNTIEFSESAVNRFKISDNVMNNFTNDVLQLVYEEDRKMLQEHLTAICEGKEKVHNLHYRWLDKEDMPVWINCRGIVIDDSQGNAQYLVGCMKETGNQRRADNVTGLLGGPEFNAYMRSQKTHLSKGFLMHIGIDDFGKIRNKDFYFVDKTAFIRQLIDSPREVTLITRPRRFGKTLTMSMLEYFFSIEKESQSRHLFDHLAIEQAGPEYMAQRGQYPVIFLTLKDIQNPSWTTWERMLSFIRLFLAQVYDRYRYIREKADINEVQARLFDHVVQGQATEDELALSLTNLMAMVQSYYGRKVILLIDEYDAPIQQAWESGYYTGCIGFMRQFLSSALKTNNTLEFAVLTGITRISKESIFSGLNNLDVCSVLRDQYAEVFGFTEAEIQELLETVHHGEKLPELKKWYDGYHIGCAEIYNPWSVINYVAHDCQARPYWVRTSGNSLLRHLLSHTDELRIQMIQNLLHGKAVRVTLDDSLIYSEIDQDPGALFNLLLTTGYLTVEKVLSLSDDRYALRIPNEEIRKLYSTEIMNFLGKNVTKNTFDDLFD